MSLLKRLLALVPLPGTVCEEDAPKRPDCTCLDEHYGACPVPTPQPRYTRQEEESLRVLYHVVKRLSDPELVRHMDEFDRDAIRIGRQYLQDKEWWD